MRCRPARIRSSSTPKVQFFLAVRDGRDVGRISAQIDELVQGAATSGISA